MAPYVLLAMVIALVIYLFYAIIHLYSSPRARFAIR